MGKKGIISYKAPNLQRSSTSTSRLNHGSHRVRCIWTVRTNDPQTTFRLFLRKKHDGDQGFKLSVASMQSLIVAGDNNVAANAASIINVDDTT